MSEIAKHGLNPRLVKCKNHVNSLGTYETKQKFWADKTMFDEVSDYG